MSNNNGQPEPHEDRSPDNSPARDESSGEAVDEKVCPSSKGAEGAREDRDFLELRPSVQEPAGGSPGSRVEPQSVDDGGASGGAEPHLQSNEARAPGFVEEEVAVPATLAGGGTEEVHKVDIDDGEVDADEEDAEALQDALTRLNKLQLALDLVSDDAGDHPADGQPKCAAADSELEPDHVERQVQDEHAGADDGPVSEPDVLEEAVQLHEDLASEDSHTPDPVEGVSDPFVLAEGSPPTSEPSAPSDLDAEPEVNGDYEAEIAPAEPAEPPVAVAAYAGDWPGASDAYHTQGMPDAPQAGSQWPPVGAGPVPSSHLGPQPVAERGLSRFVAVALVVLVSGSAALYFGSQAGAWFGLWPSEPETVTASKAAPIADDRAVTNAGGSEAAGATLGSGEWSRADDASPAHQTAALDATVDEGEPGPAMGNVPLPSRFAVEPISGDAGTPIGVSIELPYKTLHVSSYLMFRDLPGGIRFSAGQPLANAWKVPLERVSDLQLIAAKSYSGSFAMEVLLVRSPEVAPEARIVPVRIAAVPGAVVKIVPLPAGPGVASAPAVRTAKRAADSEPGARGSADRPGEVRIGDASEPVVPSEGRVASVAPSALRAAPPEPAVSTEPAVASAVETKWLTRGKQLMDNGDVAGARLAFEHLVGLGSAKGALELARSYDPEVLERIAFLGPKPDINQAIAWYKKAAALGSEAARERLKQFEK